MIGVEDTEKESVLSESQKAREMRQAHLDKIKDEKKEMYYRDLIRKHLPTSEIYYLTEAKDICVPLIEAELKLKSLSYFDCLIDIYQ